MSVRDFDLSNREDIALGEYLQILRPAPAPHLAAGRQRVLAEAARLEERDRRWRRFCAGLTPNLSFALVAVTVLGVLILSTILTWGSNGSGGRFFGLFSTPTVAYTLAPLQEAPATLNSAPAEWIQATPQHTALTTTPAPIPTPEPTLRVLTTVAP